MLEHVVWYALNRCSKPVSSQNDFFFQASVIAEIMSKQKGLSVEEKRTRMLQIFYEKKEFFQLKVRLFTKLKSMTRIFFDFAVMSKYVIHFS
jgi:hypothetical protein